MEERFRKYIAGETDHLGESDLRAIIGQWPWFTGARRLLAGIVRKPDEQLSLPLMVHVSNEEIQPIAPEEFRSDLEQGIIEKFLHAESYRIDPEGEASGREVHSEESFSTEDDEELLSEDLASIYLSQGLYERAEEIYRRLSLLYPKKSIYFAEILEKARQERESEPGESEPHS